jgi:6-phosphogluconolactonase
LNILIFTNAEIFEEKDAHEVAICVAEKFIAFIIKELQEKDAISIAFSGGSTPSLLFSELSSIKNRKKVPWEKIHIFQVDERWVPQNHKDSNFRSLKHLLLDKIPIPEENIHFMQTDDKEETCRKNYELEIKLQLGNKNPSFDLILLGMGEDGHTASIFPGKSGEKALISENLVEVPFIEKLSSLRITLTAKTLLLSRNIWVLVTGINKADIFKKVCNSKFNTQLYPIQVISKSTGKLIFFVDSEVQNGS